MQFVWNDLINRARVWVDDDHKDQQGWLSPATWLLLSQIEYSNLYRKWVRISLVRPTPTVTSFTGASTTLPGVLAIQGVGQDMGSYVRVLTNAQSTGGADPTWQGSTPNTSKSVRWEAHGQADNLLVELDPQDPNGTYLVRWIPTIPYATDATGTVDLPYGTDERLVLGMARRALVKESSRSQQLEMLMAEADAESSLATVRAGGGPRVRRVSRGGRQLSDRFGSFPTDQRFWFYY